MSDLGQLVRGSTRPNSQQLSFNEDVKHINYPITSELTELIVQLIKLNELKELKN